MSTKVNIKKRALLAALESTLGVVTTACKQVGIDRTMHYRWMKQDAKYRAKVEDIENISLDFGESKLFENMQSGDTVSIIFFLKTKGKNRGYTERTEIEKRDVNQFAELQRRVNQRVKDESEGT